MSELKDNTEKKSIGRFRTSRKYEKFVSGVRNAKVRLFRDEAFIDGGVFSGMLEGVKLKMTVRDEGTVDLEEVSDTNLTDEAMLGRLVEQIDDMETNHYSQKYIVSSLTFKDKNDDICYLGVEYQTPMNRLNSLFEEDEDGDIDVEISDKGRSALDMLLNSEEFQEEEEDEIEESVEEESTDKDFSGSSYETMVRDSIEKSKKEKLEELKNRIQSSISDINRYKSEKGILENKIEEVSESLAILEKRLDSMGEKQEPNGMVFFVSEEQKEDIGLTEDNRGIADKIADLIGLKKDVLFEQLTEGYYEIKLGDSEDIENKDFKISNDSLELIKAIDFNGTFSTNDRKTIKYQGKLNWHQLVSNMIRLGFVQDEKFDEISGSNSYKLNKEKED